jgi:hypothetical protein
LHNKYSQRVHQLQFQFFSDKGLTHNTTAPPCNRRFPAVSAKHQEQRCLHRGIVIKNVVQSFAIVWFETLVTAAPSCYLPSFFGAK